MDPDREKNLTLGYNKSKDIFGKALILRLTFCQYEYCIWLLLWNIDRWTLTSAYVWWPIIHEQKKIKTWDQLLQRALYLSYHMSIVNNMIYYLIPVKYGYINFSPILQLYIYNLITEMCLSSPLSSECSFISVVRI